MFFHLLPVLILPDSKQHLSRTDDFIIFLLADITRVRNRRLANIAVRPVHQCLVTCSNDTTDTCFASGLFVFSDFAIILHAFANLIFFPVQIKLMKV